MLTLLVALPVAQGRSPTDTGTGTSCANTVNHVFPESGSSAAFYRTTVEFGLANDDDRATIEVTGPSGAVAGSSHWANTTLLVWEMAAPLQPDTEYTATLTYSCGEASTVFRTSGVGFPLESAKALTGRRWAVDLSAGRWVEPVGVGDLVQTMLVDLTFDLAAGTVGAGGSELWLGCPEDPDSPASAGVFEDPWFSVVVNQGLTAGEPGEEVVFQPGVALTGAWTADGTRLEGATFEAELDTRSVVDWLLPGEPPETLCLLFQTFNVSCDECLDGTGPNCLHVRVDDLSGAEIDRCFEVEDPAGQGDMSSPSEEGSSRAGGPDPQGCGCASSGSPVLSAGLLLLAALGGRRRRPT